MLGITLAACSPDECREYSDYTCDQLQRKTYNVLYYDVQGATGQARELFAGQVDGLAACGAAATDMAAEHSAERVGEWSYICCLQTTDSSCAEKHR